MPIKNVTVVDQHGNLLSTQNEDKPDMGFDDKQLEYIHKLEENYTKRIEKILIPIMGKANVRAQVTADVDFSRIERAEETYKPNNQKTETASIRSQQTVESSSVGSNFDGGIPGALSNQPPEPAQAPIEVNAEEGTNPVKEEKVVPKKQRTESVTNYEVDKTIQHVHQSTGSIKRLSAAVVINYRKVAQSGGQEKNSEEEGDQSEEATEEESEEASGDKTEVASQSTPYKPLSAEELEKITSLVKEAMGYSEARGDTLTVTNSLFTFEEIQPVTEMPFWKDPDTILLAKEVGKQLLIAVIVLFFLLKIVRPFLRKLTELQEPAALSDNSENAEEAEAQANEARRLREESAKAIAEQQAHQNKIQMAKQIATEEPAIVANVVKEWVSGNG